MGSKRAKLPRRRADLIVQRLGDETVVYDRLGHKAHSLNRTAALVFDELDGSHDEADVVREVKRTLGREADHRVVAAAMHELAQADLLAPGPALPRRTVLRGLAAGLIPVVATITVPQAAAAASCALFGDPCVTDADCCTFMQCNDVGCPPPFTCYSP